MRGSSNPGVDDDLRSLEQTENQIIAQPWPTAGSKLPPFEALQVTYMRKYIHFVIISGYNR